jgi:hypothetical protein
LIVKFQILKLCIVLVVTRERTGCVCGDCA